MLSLLKIALLVSTIISPCLSRYTLSQDYTGAAFFNGGFDFFTDADPTNGHVRYIDKEEANKSGIAGLITGGWATNAVYLGMDAVHDAPAGRRSIRVQSSEAFNHGLVVADIVHMPSAVCSTWPAFWMVGPDWPANGEVDIVEGVNEQTSNRMTLHTGSGVVISEAETFTGQVVTPNCDVNAPGQERNAGCTILDGDNTTYGDGFNENGGGVYATELASAGIKIWFFPRDAIPEDIASGNPEPGEGWGTPRAAFAGDFEVDNHFKDLKIVFDTTMCGHWAGSVWANSSCAALAPTCEDFVTQNPTAFKEVYWAVNSVKVFDKTEPDKAETDTTATNDLPQRRTRSGGAVIPTLP